MSGLVRTFVAVPVDAPALVAALRAAQDGLRQLGGVAWVKPDLFHFTLRFLGEIPEERASSAASALGSLAGSGALDLTLEGLGTFPPGRPARVVWVGCGAGADALVSLAIRAEATLVAAGFPREERPFSPHLTLGRVKEPKAGGIAARRVAETPRAAFGTMRVARVVLMKSVLSPRGPAYTPLAAVAL